MPHSLYAEINSLAPSHPNLSTRLILPTVTRNAAPEGTPKFDLAIEPQNLPEPLQFLSPGSVAEGPCARPRRQASPTTVAAALHTECCCWCSTSLRRLQ